jgi:hypothetical protein
MHTVKEYKDLVKRMELQKSSGNAERRQLGVKIHSLEKQLEQVIRRSQFKVKAIVKYNEIVASNKLLRDEVDVIRRERVTLNDVRVQLTEQYSIISTKAEEMYKKYKLRTEVVNEMKEKIIQLKEKNTGQQKIYLQEFDHLQVPV